MSVPCTPDVLMFRLYLKELGVVEALKLAEQYGLELYEEEKAELVDDFLHPAKYRAYRSTRRSFQAAA